MNETAYQTFGRMLNNGELREITSFHILPADEQDFVYCTTYALQSHFPGVTFDQVKAACARASCSSTASGFDWPRSRRCVDEARGSAAE